MATRPRKPGPVVQAEADAAEALIEAAMSGSYDGGAVFETTISGTISHPLVSGEVRRRYMTKVSGSSILPRWTYVALLPSSGTTIVRMRTRFLGQKP